MNVTMQKYPLITGTKEHQLWAPAGHDMQTMKGHRGEKPRPTCVSWKEAGPCYALAGCGTWAVGNGGTCIIDLNSELIYKNASEKE